MKPFFIILILLSKIAIAQKSSYIAFIRYEKELIGTYYISDDSLLTNSPRKHIEIVTAGKPFYLYQLLFVSDKENLSTCCELFSWDKFLIPLLNYEKEFGSSKMDSLTNKYDVIANNLARFYKKLYRKKWRTINSDNRLFIIQPFKEVEFCECNNFSDLSTTPKSLFLKSFKAVRGVSLFRKREEKDLIYKIAQIESL